MNNLRVEIKKQWGGLCAVQLLTAPFEVFVICAQFWKSVKHGTLFLLKTFYFFVFDPQVIGLINKLELIDLSKMSETKWTEPFSFRADMEAASLFFFINGTNIFDTIFVSYTALQTFKVDKAWIRKTNLAH